MLPKGKILIVISVLALALCCPGPAPAATLDYYASGFYSYCLAYVMDGAGNVSNSGDKEQWSATDASTHASVAAVRQVNSSITSTGQQTSDTSNHRQVLVSVSATGTSYDGDGGFIDTYGNADTTQQNVTTGVFFIINPSAGEQVGDPVILSWDWSAQAKTGAQATATLTGGNSDNMAITLNDYPALSGSNPAATLWSYSQQSLSQNDNFTDADSGEILVHIGDIIGVHLGASVSLFVEDGFGEYNASSEQKLNLYVQAVPIPGAVWLLGSGLLGLAGLRRQLKS